MISAFILQHKPFTPQIVQNPQAVKFIVIDLFCGAGGTTTGFAKAKDCNGNPIAIIAACVNHDHKAIRSHWENHPEVYHFEEDIRTLDLTPLKHIVETYRKLYPSAKVVVWASLECTNFSKAKGGQRREADSRTLADHLDRYVIALDPDYIKIENVVEFMSWGPLNEYGKPISMKSGQDWLRWRDHINSLGYRDEWRELNSADFGAYTSRNRLFGCFAKHGLSIVWPDPTHSKIGMNKQDLFGNGLKKWMPVRDLLDFQDEGESIFNRKKPLVENSLKRIYAGLIKEVAGGKDNFIMKYNSMSREGKIRTPSTDDPMPTIACQNRLGLAQISFITKYYSGAPENKITSVNHPLGTIRTKDGHAFIKVKPFLTNYSHSSTTNDIDKQEKLALTIPCFLAKYYGTGDNVQSINEPAGTLTTKDRFTKVQVNWLDKQYSGDRNHQSVNQPAGSILANDKHALMTAKGFIYNPSHGGHTMHIDQPCATIIARQDKAPLSFIQYSIRENVRIEVYEEDSETMIKIKEFMALYGISDIRMRMLKVSELKLIQGFPADYKLYGNQSDQKKFIGNSVVPHVVQCWAEAQAHKISIAA
ncbi:DNA cytosine methyltransferase [Sphingobacterium spiritivorum]|uniref:DNA cytosine methyltransferase n=1 Tax=Sphingobacterium spiritivorum TaxID=258 RepID=UPI003DA68A55